MMSFLPSSILWISFCVFAEVHRANAVDYTRIRRRYFNSEDLVVQPKANVFVSCARIESDSELCCAIDINTDSEVFRICQSECPTRLKCDEQQQPNSRELLVAVDKTFFENTCITTNFFHSSGGFKLDTSTPTVPSVGTCPAVYGGFTRNDNAGTWQVAYNYGGMSLAFQESDGGKQATGLFLLQQNPPLEFAAMKDQLELDMLTNRAQFLSMLRFSFVIEESGKFYISKQSKDYAADGIQWGYAFQTFANAMNMKWYPYHPALSEDSVAIPGLVQAYPTFQNIGWIGVVIFAGRNTVGSVGSGALTIDVRSFKGTVGGPEPTQAPSSPPSAAPSDIHSMVPSAVPSSHPSLSPSEAPSLHPSISPTAGPTMHPSMFPSSSPSLSPSAAPSSGPSVFLSSHPSESPSLAPSVSKVPSMAPSAAPSLSTSTSPSASPTAMTVAPSLSTSTSPSRSPTAPTVAVPTSTTTPVAAPSPIVPILKPLSRFTWSPVSEPTSSPSVGATIVPTTDPTLPERSTTRPTTAPTLPERSTTRPTTAPTLSERSTTRPTTAPTLPERSTTRPTAAPTLSERSTTRPTTAPTLPERSTTRPTAAPTAAPSAQESSPLSSPPSLAPSTTSARAVSPGPTSAPSTYATDTPSQQEVGLQLTRSPSTFPPASTHQTGAPSQAEKTGEDVYSTPPPVDQSAKPSQAPTVGGSDKSVDTTTSSPTPPRTPELARNSIPLLQREIMVSDLTITLRRAEVMSSPYLEVFEDTLQDWYTTYYSDKLTCNERRRLESYSVLSTEIDVRMQTITYNKNDVQAVDITYTFVITFEDAMSRRLAECDPAIDIENMSGTEIMETPFRDVRANVELTEALNENIPALENVDPLLPIPKRGTDRKESIRTNYEDSPRQGSTVSSMPMAVIVTITVAVVSSMLGACCILVSLLKRRNDDWEDDLPEAKEEYS